MSALKGHPKGLYLIFATSTAERFSYYGMRAIFILFLTQALLFDKEAAASIYGSYTGLVYLTPLIGGYIADKYWGIRRSVFWGAVMMAVGQFLMFMSASTLNNTELAHWLMYGGLGFLILGNGCFKPTVSSGEMTTRPECRSCSLQPATGSAGSPELPVATISHLIPTASNGTDC